MKIRPSVAKNENLLRGLGEEALLQPVVAFELQARQVFDMAFESPNPALLRDDDSDQLTLDHRRREVEIGDFRRVGELRAASAERRVLAELFLQIAQLNADHFPLLRIVREQFVDVLFFFGQFVELATQFHFLKTTQAAQPRIEDVIGLNVGEIERRFQKILWLILLADDADHFIQIEEDDAHAGKHFEPVCNFSEPEARTPLQDGAAMIEPLPQCLLQRNDARGSHHRRARSCSSGSGSQARSS